MMFTSAYNQLQTFEREFVDGYIAALIRANEQQFERLTVTLERFSNALDLDALDDRTRDQFAKPLVRVAIRERTEAIAAERDLTADRIIKEHAAIGLANIQRFFPTIGEDGIPVFDATDCTSVDWAAVQSLDIEETYGKVTKRTVKVKFHNKQASLDAIAKFMGLDKADNPEYAAYRALPGNLAGLPTSASTEQLAEEYAKLIAG